ncbi:MAG: hypothetical protein ABI112_05655 [Terracoccus sp.]
MSRRVFQVVLVVVSMVAGRTASELKWPLWAAVVLALFLYALVWAASRLVPAHAQPPEPADLRLVRLKRRR